MKPKLTELDMLKYWIDSEFTILHIMFAVILWQLTEGWLPHILIGIYIFISVMYVIARLAYVASQDPKYLKITKNDR